MQQTVSVTPREARDRWAAIVHALIWLSVVKWAHVSCLTVFP